MLEFNLSRSDGNWARPWVQQQVALTEGYTLNRTDRLSGMWLRQIFYVGSVPDNSGRLYIAETRGGLTSLLPRVDVVDAEAAGPAYPTVVPFTHLLNWQPDHLMQQGDDDNGPYLMLPPPPMASPITEQMSSPGSDDDDGPPDGSGPPGGGGPPGSGGGPGGDGGFGGPGGGPPPSTLGTQQGSVSPSASSGSWVTTEGSNEPPAGPTGNFQVVQPQFMGPVPVVWGGPRPGVLGNQKQPGSQAGSGSWVSTEGSTGGPKTPQWGTGPGGASPTGSAGSGGSTHTVAFPWPSPSVSSSSSGGEPNGVNGAGGEHGGDAGGGEAGGGGGGGNGVNGAGPELPPGGLFGKKLSGKLALNKMPAEKSMVAIKHPLKLPIAKKQGNAKKHAHVAQNGTNGTIGAKSLSPPPFHDSSSDSGSGSDPLFVSGIPGSQSESSSSNSGSGGKTPAGGAGQGPNPTIVVSPAPPAGALNPLGFQAPPNWYQTGSPEHAPISSSDEAGYHSTVTTHQSGRAPTPEAGSDAGSFHSNVSAGGHSPVGHKNVHLPPSDDENDNSATPVVGPPSVGSVGGFHDSEDTEMVDYTD